MALTAHISPDGRGPVAVITGASAGIGRACVRAFANAGYDVALVARGHAGLEGARSEIEASGQRALVFAADIAEADAVFAAADRIAEAWGGIDVWINNAMLTVFGPVDRISPAEFRRVTDVCYLGAVHGTLAALRHMRKYNRGTIVQVGSALSYRSIPLQAPYCGSQFALRGFTDALRSELIHQGSDVRLSMVQLPAVNTPQFGWSRTHMLRRHRPVGRIHQPEVAAKAILRAAHTAPRELWVGRSAIQTILGSMLAPSIADRLASSAYTSQISERQADTEGDIMYVPAGRDHGAHGRFDSEAVENGWSVDERIVRVCAGLAGLGAIAGAFLLGRRSRPDHITPAGRALLDLGRVPEEPRLIDEHGQERL